MKKYFLDCDTRILYIVPKSFWKWIDVVNDQTTKDWMVNEAKNMIVKNSTPLLYVDAMTQTL